MERGGRAPAVDMARRLFFALWPDEAVRRAIANLASTLPMPRGAKVTRPQRLHLTVVFLGDFAPLPDSMLSAIQSAAGSIRARAFELSLDRVDSFARARVGWLGTSSVPDALTALHNALGTALQSAGVPLKPDVPFVPHVTIQRNVRTPPPAMDISPIVWTVRDFVLVESMPGSPEPYRIIGAWPLVPQ